MTISIDENCLVEHCDKPIKSRGYCNIHYMEMWRQGVFKTEEYKLLRKQNSTLHARWNKMHSMSEVCEEWKDFWQYLKDIGEQPKNSKKMLRLDDTKPWGPNNFKWSFPLEGELKNQYYRKLNKDNPKYRNGRYLKNYGVTLEQYENLFKEQDGKCAICKKEETRVIRNGRDESKRRLALDHCHTTNKLRGLLCSDCNPGLGNFKDSVENLVNAIAYLEKYKE